MEGVGFQYHRYVVDREMSAPVLKDIKESRKLYPGLDPNIEYNIYVFKH
jgi:hypothetical protein